MGQTLRRRLAGVVCLVVLGTGESVAQGASVEVFMGQYSPTQDLFQVTRAGSAGTYRLTSGTSRGGTVSLDLNKRVGVRVSGGTLDNALAYTPSGAGTPSRAPAELRHGSLQGVLGLTPGEGNAQPYLSVGMSYAQRRGQAFEGQSEPTSYGMALGAGVRFRLSMLSLNVGAEVLDYTATYDVPGRPPRDFIQRDILLRLGGGVAVGR